MESKIPKHKGVLVAVEAGLTKISADEADHFTNLKISTTYGSLIKGRGTHVPFTGYYFIYADREGSMPFNPDLVKGVFALEEHNHTAFYHMRLDPAREPVITPLGTDVPFECYYYVPNSEAEEWIDTVKGT